MPQFSEEQLMSLIYKALQESSGQKKMPIPGARVGAISAEETPREYGQLGDIAQNMGGLAGQMGPRLRKMRPGQVRVPSVGTGMPLAHLNARELAKEAAELAGGSGADAPMYKAMMEPGGKAVTFGTDEDLKERYKGMRHTGDIARKVDAYGDHLRYMKYKLRRKHR